MNKKLIKIKQLLAQIKRDFDDPTIVQMASDRPLKIDSISTGSLSLNTALGVGGFPKGRLTELYGGESSGKTTLSLSAIRDVQQSGGIAALIDVEGSFDVLYAKTIGVNMEELIFSQPSNGEEALNLMESLIKSNTVDIVVLDSVAALVPLKELESTMEQEFMGLQARMLGKALRKLAAITNKSNTCVIFINQIREKIGIIYGNPETTPGGRALKFYASIRLELRRKEYIKKDETVIGIRVNAKVVKNKVAPPFKACEFDIRYNCGVDNINEVINLAIQKGVIKNSGNWYEYNEQHLQGKDQIYNYIKENNLLQQLEKELK